MKAQVKLSPTIHNMQVIEKSPHKEDTRLNTFLSHITKMFPAQRAALREAKSIDGFPQMLRTSKVEHPLVLSLSEVAFLIPPKNS